jgi:predicted amidohydrolase YtcJ
MAADFILYSGNIETMDGRGTVASALAVKDGAIVCVGTHEECLDLKGDETRLIDAGVLLIGGKFLRREKCYKVFKKDVPFY